MMTQVLGGGGGVGGWWRWRVDVDALGASFKASLSVVISAKSVGGVTWECISMSHFSGKPSKQQFRSATIAAPGSLLSVLKTTSGACKDYNLLQSLLESNVV